MEPNSKILFNIGLIHAANGYHEDAVTNFNAATELDTYLAIAWVPLFHWDVEEFSDAELRVTARPRAGTSNAAYRISYSDGISSRSRTLMLRSNTYGRINGCTFSFRFSCRVSFLPNLTRPSPTLSDYEQLGLKFKLWSAEVLYNRGLCLIYMNQLDNGMRDLQAAKREKQVPDHDVIDDAIAAQGRQFTVFSLVGGMSTPSGGKSADRHLCVPPSSKKASCTDPRQIR